MERTVYFWASDERRLVACSLDEGYPSIEVAMDGISEETVESKGWKLYKVQFLSTRIEEVGRKDREWAMALASVVLRNPDSPEVAKRLAGCVLTQCADHLARAKAKRKKKPAAKEMNPAVMKA